MIPAGFEPVLRELAPLRDRFLAAGHRLYLVGGTVRDLLLDDVAVDVDLDVTTPARPAEVKRLVQGWADAVWTQGERFGTIGAMRRVVDHRTGAPIERIVEITTHRADSYDGLTRKPTVEFSDRIDEDLSRRDFTVNAIAIDLTADEPSIVDPFDGARDLSARVLRTPLDPHVSFSDDPLRMLRAARFVARFGLVPVAELIDAVVEMADRLSIVSAERIHVEMVKLMSAADPTDGLDLVVDTGIGAHVVPELSALDPAARRSVLAAVRAVPATTPVARLAALLVPAGAESARARMRAWKASADDIRTVAAIVRTVDRVEEHLTRGSTLDDEQVRRLVHDAGIVLDDALVVTHARASVVSADRSAAVDAVVERVRELRATGELDDLGPEIDGADVMALLDVAPGRQVGEALGWLQDLRLREGRLGRDEARARLRAHWETRG